MLPEQESELATARLISRLKWRILPLVSLGYALCIVDRGNISFAKIEMTGDLSLTETQFGIASGVFFASYCSMQVPNLQLLARFGARRVLAGALITWGLLSAAMSLIQTDGQLYLLRFLLGFAESGYYPGAVLYISHWFPDAAAGEAAMIFTLFANIGSCLGVASAGFILDGPLAGMRLSWRSLFVIQGLPAVLLGLVVLALVGDDPASAPWLSKPERALLLSLRPDGLVPDAAPLPSGPLASSLLEAAVGEPDASGGASAVCVAGGAVRARALRLGQSLPRVLRRGGTYLFGLRHYSEATLTYLALYFMPQLWHELLPSWKLWEVSLLASAPSLVTILLGPPTAAWADRGGSGWRTLRRRFALVFGTAVWVGLVYLGAGTAMLRAADGSSSHGERRAAAVAAIGVLAIGSASSLGSVGAFWALHHHHTPRELHPISIAVVNSIGNLGGFTGPYLLGFFHDRLGPPCPADGPTDCVARFGWGIVLLAASTLVLVFGLAAAAWRLLRLAEAWRSVRLLDEFDAAPQQ